MSIQGEHEMRIPARSTLPTLLAAVFLAGPAQAQEEGLRRGLEVAEIRVSPSTLEVEVGQETTFDVSLLDSNGNPVQGALLRMGGDRRGFTLMDDGGAVRGVQAGEYELILTVAIPPGSGGQPVTSRVPVVVSWPAIASVEVWGTESTLYERTTVRLEASALHGDGSERPETPIQWLSSDGSIASVDRHGNVTGLAAGAVTVSAVAEGVVGSLEIEVAPFTGDRIEIRGGADLARTGDVLTFEAAVLDGSGAVLSAVPVDWGVAFLPDDSIHAPGASGLVRNGKFVGEEPGQYTLMASAGGLSARKTVDVRPRNVIQSVEVVGQGSVNSVHTSDLWIFQGLDGRDYGVTGTWGGDGWAFFWDVTEPTNPVKTDSIQVDARTVNDVKVSPDGRYAALSREGASNRRNGVVILDLADPAHPTIASVYDDGLTGGVHNMFATDEHLFALSAGDKYVILDMSDIYAPTYVSEYNHPESRIHDVWVHDGIAYSSEWGTGVVVVDVGNGRWGGSIDSPVFVTSVPYPVGATHAAFPYHQEETGRFYLFLGDEIMARGGAAWSGAGLGQIPQQGGTPSVTSGYIHIIDFTDPEHPADVARYEVKEFGTHNMWVEDDVLYVAYYEGGVRVVDVSGELMGNLATQGREMAVYKAFDPNGYVANAPMAWGPQPYKGYLFFSDFNSGLHAVKIQPRSRPAT
jgi:hypothetical protein